jgi:DDE superfamily endonuclease
LTLFPTLLPLCGKVNFTNLSRYSDLSEKTFRRQYSHPFNFIALNAHLIAATPPAVGARIAAMDHSFIPKSGKQTYGLDWFYNGSASRSEKGLEISTLAIVDVHARQAYTLSAQQTPVPLAQAQATQTAPAPQTISQAALERVQAQLQQLPPVPMAPEISLMMIERAQAQLQQLPPVQPTRLDHAIAQQKSAPSFPKVLQYLAVDAAFSNQKFVDAGLSLSFHLVGKLRHDANLKSLYEGEQKPRAAKRKYEILAYYRARFQIEFIYREAKQFTGLCDAQTRDAKRLDFHFNASLTALNLARFEAHSRQAQADESSKATSFSMTSYKRVAFNDHLLSRFISKLNLDSTLIKSHPNYETLRSYGVIDS